MKKRFLAILILITASTSNAYDAPRAKAAPIIDGEPTDLAWKNAQWEAIDQLNLGSQPSRDDFSGRFKLVWTPKKLYLLAEIVDDVVIDTHADPLDQYWEDDALEFLIDEDQSGGNHLDSHNAFAYHISIDNQAVDFSSQGTPALYNEHVESVWKRDAKNPNKLYWEVSVDVYADDFSDTENKAVPVTLSADKKMGFIMAYCDSDNAQDGRQHFMLSHDVPAVDGDKNRAYKDASVFDSLVLVD